MPDAAAETTATGASRCGGWMSAMVFRSLSVVDSVYSTHHAKPPARLRASSRGPTSCWVVDEDGRTTVSLHSVERLLYDLNRDPAKVAAFQAEPDAVLSEYELTQNEADWLVNRDILALYRHGVHPLLLAPASRFFQIDQRDFRAALAPAVGERLR
jgi:hypothetical protein